MINTSCNRCSECDRLTHHWMDNPNFGDACHVTAEHQYTCKHCDVLGDPCPACQGEGCEGCDKCDGEGVVAFLPELQAYHIDKLKEIGFRWNDGDDLYLYVNRGHGARCDVRYWPQVDRFTIADQEIEFQLLDLPHSGLRYFLSSLRIATR